MILVVLNMLFFQIPNFQMTLLGKVNNKTCTCHLNFSDKIICINGNNYGVQRIIKKNYIIFNNYTH